MKNYLIIIKKAILTVSLLAAFLVNAQPVIEVIQENGKVFLSHEGLPSADWDIQWTKSLKDPVFWRTFNPESQTFNENQSTPFSSGLRSRTELINKEAIYFRVASPDFIADEELIVEEDAVGVITSYSKFSAALAAADNGSELRVLTDVKVEANMVWSGDYPGEAGASIVGKNDVRIVGVNMPRVTSSSFGDFLYIKNCSNITISGIHFDGQGTSPSSLPNPYAALLNIGPGNRAIVIENCLFTNFQGHGVSQLFGDKVTFGVVVKNCEFVEIGNPSHPILTTDGAAVSGVGSDWLVSHNTITECLRGIEVEGPGPTPQKNIRILNNTINNIWNEEIMLYVTSVPSAKFARKSFFCSK